MTGRLSCPDRGQHAAAHPHLSAVTAPMGNTSRVVALLAEGHCPACPHRQLTNEQHTRYGQSYTWARCDCCGALWELDRGEYVIHDRGRLVDI